MKEGGGRDNINKNMKLESDGSLITEQIWKSWTLSQQWGKLRSNQICVAEPPKSSVVEKAGLKLGEWV